MGKCIEESSVCKMDTSRWEWERGKATSIISEWDLICGNSFKAAIPRLLFFVGALAGYIILGPLADTWLGRKRMLILSSFMLSVSGILTAGDHYQKIARRAQMERPHWFSLILIRHNRIPFNSSPRLPHETPIFMANDGRSEEALQNLKRLAELNGGSLPENVRIEDRRAETQSNSALSHLLGTQWVRKSVALNALSELPAGIISTLLVARARRRRAILLLTLTSAIFCFVCVFLSGDKTNPDKPSSNQTKFTAGKYPRLVGKLGAFVSAVTAFNVMLIFCLELSPTAVRNSAMSMLRQASGVGAIASPVIVFIGRNSPALSFALSGVAIILSGFFVLGLPETKDQPLYDTLEGQEWEEKDLINRSNNPLLS
ncbi:organic cation/carnitine transporter 3-like [Cryptomeria japonica]|uniref:organic cation/carnitine transporter 3-like n=1 Tax=Cryptomeria japonica TaxID=3369 RepID=UPI0027D9D6FA|nr:organic cation/carnitine transporter 3-like [Cryptomeria japonica]